METLTALSRAPHAALPLPQEEKVLVSDKGCSFCCTLQAPPSFTIEKLKGRQDRDDHHSDLRWWKTMPPTEAEKQLLSTRSTPSAFPPSLTTPRHHHPAMAVFKCPTTESLVITSEFPHALRHRIIESAHQFLGHAGVNATSHFCRKRLFMFRLVPEVHRVIRHCHQCQVKDQKAPKQKDVYRPSVQAGAPFQVWSMDILGPLRVSSKGHRYLLTLKDVFSKWFEAIQLSNTTSDKVLRALQMLYARFGHPLQVHKDNATYFRSQLMQEAFKRAGIRLTFTPTYNPQSNSVERVHRDLNVMLRVLCHQHAADWEEVLPAALLALRSAVHESTGVTPFACVYGREPATPLDILCRFPGCSPGCPQLRPTAGRSPVQGPSSRPGPAHPCPPTAAPVDTETKEMRSRLERESGCLLPSPPLIVSLPFHTPALGGLPTNPQGTLRTIHPEGSWCQQPKSITVSLNRLKRCHGEDDASQQVDFDLRQLEDADDSAEGPMLNSWVTTDRAAATRALNHERR